MERGETVAAAVRIDPVVEELLHFRGVVCVDRLEQASDTSLLSSSKASFKHAEYL